MFTGIVQSMGVVKAWKGKTLVVEGPLKVKTGDSVAVEGACLTVAKKSVAGRRVSVAFDLSQETLDKTTLGALRPGDRVNLEPSLRLGDALGGHFVSGHVEGVGRILGKLPGQGWTLYKVQGYPGLGRFLVPKGSVTVDGISLTPVETTGDDFTVAVIPHTEAVTSLGRKTAGAAVNLEPDLIAKHVAHLLELK